MARRAQRPPETGVGAVGHDHVPGSDLLRAEAVPALDDGAAHEPPLDHRLEGLGALPEGDAGLDGVVDNELVELTAAHHVAVGGVDRMLRPGELEGLAVRGGPQPSEAVERGELLAQAHLVELPDGTRREAVAAGLLAGKPFFSTTSTSWPCCASQ